MAKQFIDLTPFSDLAEHWPELFEEFSESVKLILTKNKDYAGEKHRFGRLGNIGECSELGVEPWIGVLVRMSDKWSRTKNIVRTGKNHVEDEPLEVTLRDLANYCLICLVAKKTFDADAEEIPVMDTDFPGTLDYVSVES